VATTARRRRRTTRKYLPLNRYQGGPAPAVDWAPTEQWTPEEVDAHMQFMHDFAARLEQTGEFADSP
jgi:hypothetical protein